MCVDGMKLLNEQNQAVTCVSMSACFATQTALKIPSYSSSVGHTHLKTFNLLGH